MSAREPFNFLEVPTDIMFQVVLWRVRYKLSLRDLAEMFLQRGFSSTHETVREWEVRFGRQEKPLTSNSTLVYTFLIRPWEGLGRVWVAKAVGFLLVQHLK